MPLPGVHPSPSRGNVVGPFGAREASGAAGITPEIPAAPEKLSVRGALTGLAR